MKVGVLLQPRKDDLRYTKTPLLFILEIKKHPDDSSLDKFCLQWVPRNGGKSLNGELSRFIVEDRYEMA